VHREVVLFDLDGTLTESGPGIMRSLAVAFDAVGAPQLDQADMLRFVGPPLLHSFREVAGLDEPTSLAALKAYRRYFVEHGMFENSVYPGIADLLQELHNSGRRLAVATSKPLIYAHQIVEHFGLADYFLAVCGPELDGVGAVKTQVVADAMTALDVTAGGDVALSGDRSHDVAGAHANGIACIGVLWGYGSREELAAADAIVSDVGALRHLLDGTTA
jgi:phosphoglycolate phosphatase